MAVLPVAACAPAPAAETTGTMTAATTTSMTPATTTTTSATTTSSIASAPISESLPDIGLEIRVPDGDGPFPSVVLVHGGGWVGGSPALMTDLARFLTDEGYLTVNAAYTLSDGVAGFPIAVDDVACAVRYAAAHPEGDGTVAILGHSAGAHLAALVALDEGGYGAGCPLADPVVPDRLLGLAGPYDVARLGPLMLPFFGVSPTDDPEVWVAGNPMWHTDANAGLSSLIMHGAEDALVDYTFAAAFADALTAGGSEALIEVVEGARHNDMHDPDVVGDLMVTWLDRVD